MNFSGALAVLLSWAACADAFMIGTPRVSSTPSSQLASSESEVDLGLTPELKKVTDAFSGISDEQVRYKQLLHMAQHTTEVNNMPESSMTPENKVPGCLSTVYIDGTAEYSEEAGDYVIKFIGDSDGLLTRGLAALLVRCLSGNTAEVIQKVDPQFIKVAQIEQSLTPGRNNGFLNMLKSMKDKAISLEAAAKEGGEGVRDAVAANNIAEEESVEEPTEDPSRGPKYNAIVAALQALKPTTLVLVDNSQQHAGHAGNDMDGESHFEVQMVAEAFEGLDLVKRHQLIYMILGDLMPQIHALQIQSLTPEEAERRSS